MMKHTHNDSWGHERLTKPADIDTAFRLPQFIPPAASASIWPDTALVVTLVFALFFSLVLTLGW